MAPWRDSYHNIYIITLHQALFLSTHYSLGPQWPLSASGVLFIPFLAPEFITFRSWLGGVLEFWPPSKSLNRMSECPRLFHRWYLFSASHLPGSPNAGKLKNRTFLSSVNIQFHIFSGFLLSNSSSRYTATPSIAHASTPLAFARMIKYFARTPHSRRHKPSH
jgi:hypothetical protein